MPRSRHPRGLYVLFLSEMWERFSFYGMRALLILYLVNYLKWRQSEASNVYKWYTSLVYLTPILGGFLADRYLGNKRAVVIGALLMAAGHFLMAVDTMGAFYTALGLLIVGNGFFKPNISTQVGRLYSQDDPRRDSAYTIFYMGINLGAFLSPIVCGVLAAGTPWGYHAGFAAAGVGMVIGLVTYLVGLRWVVELPPGEAAATTSGAAMSEAAASRAPPALPRLEKMSPRLVAGFGVAVLGFVATIAIAKVVGIGALGSLVSGDNLVTLGLLGGCALLGAGIVSQVEGAARERVLAIYAMGVFCVFFWAAFEQTGNTFNLWADKQTNRYVTMEPPPPSPLPEVISDADPSQTSTTAWEYIRGLFRLDPFPTAWFQSANSLAIVLFGPVFTALWLALARRRLEPSTPAKMAIGVVFMALASGVMAIAARSEDRPSSTALAALPPAMVLDGEGRLCEKTAEGGLAPFHAGRLRYDPARKVLEMAGVLPDTERDRILRETAPAAYQAAVKDLAERSEKWREGQPPITLTLGEVPPGFDLRYAGFPEKKVRFDSTSRTLSAAMVLEDKDQKALLVAAAEPVLRDALNDLYVGSDVFRVSPWYLILCYLFMTFGELCLSPVGLSMVSKLAPARFATMLMGLWFLTNSLGNFVAGALGESWGTVAPIPYFLLIVLVLGGAAAVAFIIGRKISALMHGVH